MARVDRLDGRGDCPVVLQVCAYLFLCCLIGRLVCIYSCIYSYVRKDAKRDQFGLQMPPPASLRIWYSSVSSHLVVLITIPAGNRLLQRALPTRLHQAL